MSDTSLILEGIVTTLNADRSLNISPMGPAVDREVTRLCLRPFAGSRTYDNLRRHGQGVFHVTDDVELIAHSAVGTVDPIPPNRPATAVEGRILQDACRWYAFKVLRWHDNSPRATVDCQIVERGWLRDFFGFNRAKHAVVEAAILATRIQLLGAAEVERQLNELAVWVDKTGGDQERRAFAFLQDYVRRNPTLPSASEA
jgi:hypothetical protein